MAFSPMKWWTGLSEPAQKLWLALLGLIIPSLVGGTQVYDWLEKRWDKEDYIVGVATTRVAPQPSGGSYKDPKLNEALEHMWQNGYDIITTVGIINETSHDLTKVVIRLPRTGHAARLNENLALVSLDPFNYRVELPPIPPGAANSVSFYHKIHLQPGEEIIVTTAEKGRKVIPVRSSDNLVTIRYAWGFWIAFGTLLAMAVWHLVSWLRYRRKARSRIILPH